MIFRLGELFCGPGGLGLGASRAKIRKGGRPWGVTHAWATDYDADACDTYRRNLCPKDPDSVVCKDIRQLDFNQLGPIDALAFGFPCNDYSIISERKGINGKFGPLYTFGVRALEHFQPMWFIAENVGGLRSADDGSTIRQILEELENVAPGYRLTTHLYKFEEYGVPQTRHRLIIVGVRADQELQFAVPAPTQLISFRTVAEALKQPPIPGEAPNHEPTRQSPRVVERLKHIKPGENAWNARLPPALRLKVKGAKLSQIYKRLDPRKPSYTITGSGGGGTHCYHWAENRALTNRERARIQTFPDDFIFYGGKESVRRQIGMAVPPLAAQELVTAVLKTFAEVRYKGVPAFWGNDTIGKKGTVPPNLPFNFAVAPPERP